LALQRLGHITGESRYLDAAERTLQLFYPMFSRHPNGCTSLLLALEEAIEPPRVVVLSGPPEHMRQWRRSLDRAYLPTTVILAVAPGATDLPPLLAKPAGSEAVNAWICQGVTCLPPVATLESLLEALNVAEIG
jgi:hypothetical protein